MRVLGEDELRLPGGGERFSLRGPFFVLTGILAFALTIRTFYPKAPDYFDVNAWALAPKGESQRLRDVRRRRGRHRPCTGCAPGWRR